MRGYTRTAAFGPIANLVESQGGSITRVFNNVGLPLSLLANPDLPLPLVEQYRVLDEASREIGDPFIGASLGQLVNVKDLGAYGTWMCNAQTLANLIDRCERGIHRYLQTATRIQLRVEENGAVFSIEFLDTRSEPWLQNELLGVSYLIDCVRQFTGRCWSPSLIRSTCAGAKNAAALEKIFRAPVQHGAAISAIEFDSALLTKSRVQARNLPIRDEPALPNAQCYREDTSAMIAIALLEKQPKIDWVASRMGVSRRSLQRALDHQGCSFSDILEELLKDRAIDQLRLSNQSITDIGLNLGYSDSAHFTRAFHRWTGMSPSLFRTKSRQGFAATAVE